MKIDNFKTMFILGAVLALGASNVFARATNSRQCHLSTKHMGFIQEVVEDADWDTFVKTRAAAGVNATQEFMKDRNVYAPSMTCESRKVTSSGKLADFYIHDHSQGKDFMYITVKTSKRKGGGGALKTLRIMVKRDPRTPGLFTYSHVATGVNNNGNNWQDSEHCRDSSNSYIRLYDRFSDEQTIMDKQTYDHVLARIVRHYTDCIPGVDDCQISMMDKMEGYFSKNYLLEDDNKVGAVGNKEVRIP